MNTVIKGNIVGLSTNGMSAVGNIGDGILIAGGSGTQIGGTDQYEGNEIGGNGGNGVNIAGGNGILVAGNFIGTDPTGALLLGNELNGVSLGSSSNTVGGTAAGAGNVIDNNGSGSTGAGVQLVGIVNDDSILSNSIFNNAGLGINLGEGPTPNHPPGTPGPNNYQNYPVLSLAASDGSTTTITGTLSAADNASYLVQFFSSPKADALGFGQGKNLIGSTQVVTNSAGVANFTAPGSGVGPGQSISATATDSQGNTSEFCQDIATQGQIDLVLSGTAAPTTVLAGGQVTYTLTVTNQGDEDAHDVVLTDQLPSGVSINSTQVSQGFILSGQPQGEVVANLETVPAGGTATLTGCADRGDVGRVR